MEQNPIGKVWDTMSPPGYWTHIIKQIRNSRWVCVVGGAGSWTRRPCTWRTIERGSPPTTPLIHLRTFPSGITFCSIHLTSLRDVLNHSNGPHPSLYNVWWTKVVHSLRLVKGSIVKHIVDVGEDDDLVRCCWRGTGNAARGSEGLRITSTDYEQGSDLFLSG